MQIKTKIIKLLLSLILAALFVSVVFLFPEVSTADLALPTTACDQQMINAIHLRSGMTQEDGTKVFKYGSTNNNFVSINGDVLTINFELLFPIDDTMPYKVIRLLLFSANCTSVYGQAFTNFSTPSNTIKYNRITTETQFNDDPSYFPLAYGFPRYLGFEVWDGKNSSNYASFSYLIDVNDPQNPTGSTDESSEPDGLRPVLIIPGIMGTELYENDELAWPNIPKILDRTADSFILESLALDQNGNSIKNVIRGDIIKTIDIPLFGVDTFQGLINLLESLNYQNEETYFKYSYDWRLDLDTNLELVKDKIEEIKANTGFNSVDVVAHSMGGLVIKDYLAEYGISSVNRLIFVGTPHLGAPKSAKALLEGDIDMPFRILNKGTIKRLSLNSPSIYQLLPNSKYFTQGPEYIQLSSGELLDYNSTKSFFSSKNLNATLINKAEQFFSKNLHEMSFGDINVYNIAGCATFTQSRYVYNYTNDYIYAIRGKSGDGTVPLVSADYINVPNSKKFYVKNGKHSSLPSHQSVKELILDILNGNVGLYDNIKSDQSQCNIRGKQFNWKSPVEIHIYDQNGNHAGPISGGFENNLPRVDYEIINGEKFIYIPTDDGNTYTIDAVGEGTGTFDLVISDIDNGEVTGSIVYNDVAITSSSQIDVTLDGIVSFDYEGDGSPQTLLASSVLSGEALDDLTAPESEIKINGSAPESDYIGDATVVLTAEDGNSGVLQIKYSTDGVSYKTYSNPVVIQSVGNNEFKYYAIDNAGNNEEIKTQVITVSAFSAGGGSTVAEEPIVPKPEEPPGKVLGERTENPEVTKEDKKLVVEKVKDGTLVLDSTDNRTVYIIGTGGKKYGFISQEIFWGLGYSFDSLVSADVSEYELGGLIDTTNRAHPDGTLVIDETGTVWWINQGQKIGFSTMESLRTQGLNLQNIIIANYYDINLQQGTII